VTKNYRHMMMKQKIGEQSHINLSLVKIGQLHLSQAINIKYSGELTQCNLE
jgi:predicted acyltransferase (DUF342 family)